MTEQKHPTLQDIISLAERLGVQFTMYGNNAVFDLDRREPMLEGTYQNTQAGIATAYCDLMTYQLFLEATNKEASPDVVTPHLEVDSEQIPRKTVAFIEALTAFLADQTDATGLKVSNLRMQAKSLRIHFERVEGLLGIIEQRNQEQR